MIENVPLRIHDEATVRVERGISLELLRMLLAGKCKMEHFRNGEKIGDINFPNGIVDVGLNSILGVQFHADTQITAWYIGLVDNASFSAFANGDTMGSHSGWIESSDYSESTRPAWTAGAASSRSITNSATVDFTINATKTLKGIFIASNSTKGGTTGTLWSTAAFGSTVSVVNADVLKITYTVSG